MDRSPSGFMAKYAPVKPAAVMANNDVLFTVKGGPVLVEALISECVTANDGTASTLKYVAVPTVGTATDLCAASASLASAAAGATVAAKLDALATAAALNANGPGIGPGGGSVIVPPGTIKAGIGVGSTTGTWRHYIRYRPLAAGAIVE
jgi:hypothetical protein